MSSPRKLTFSAIVAALCTVILYLSVLMPGMSMAITGLAGLFPAAVVILCGNGWAVGTYGTAALLSLLLLPDKTAPLWFLFFFGHYPIWKAWAEGLQIKTGKPALGWLLKLIGFGVCLTLLYLLFRSGFLGAVPGMIRDQSLLLIGLLLAAAFVVYDVAFSILIGYFRIHILPRINQRS